MKTPKLNFVLPSKGLKEPTLKFLEEAGWNLPGLASGRKLSEISKSDPEIKFNMRQMRDITARVASGAYDAGIVGMDRVVEDGFAIPKGYSDNDIENFKVENPNLAIVDAFGYARNLYQPSTLVVAGPQEGPNSLYEAYYKLKTPIRIGTEYMTLTRLMIEDLLDNARESSASLSDFEFIKSNGATESMIQEGEADLIADIVETGGTLQSNNLKPIETLFTSKVALVANKNALKNEFKRELISQIRYGIKSALRPLQSGMVRVTMNVPEAALDKVIKVLPALKTPTIAPLQDPSGNPVAEKWFAVETTMTRIELTKLSGKLQSLRANGILQTPIERALIFESDSKL